MVLIHYRYRFYPEVGHLVLHLGRCLERTHLQWSYCCWHCCGSCHSFYSCLCGGACDGGDGGFSAPAPHCVEHGHQRRWHDDLQVKEKIKKCSWLNHFFFNHIMFIK